MSLAGRRILVSGVVLGQPMGGVRRHNAELLPRVARLLAERGAELTVLEGQAPLPFDLPADVRRIPSTVPAGPPLARALAEGRTLRAALSEARRQGQAFTLLHTAHLPVPRRLNLPLTITIHDVRRLNPGQATRIEHVAARIALHRALRSAARVFCVTAAVRDELEQRLGLLPDRVRLLPNAGDHFAPLARSAAADGPLLHVGHVEPRKNLELLVRALALDPELPALQLAGAEKGNEAARLASIAHQLGVAERVQFLGPVNEEKLAELYADAACVVLPSRVEGFGIAVLEAQRALAPLAISDLPSLREVAGDATPRFSSEDPAACALAIRAALAATPEQLRASLENSRRYSWETTAEAWVDAWEELSSAD